MFSMQEDSKQQQFLYLIEKLSGALAAGAVWPDVAQHIVYEIAGLFGVSGYIEEVRDNKLRVVAGSSPSVYAVLSRCHNGLDVGKPSAGVVGYAARLVKEAFYVPDTQLQADYDLAFPAVRSQVVIPLFVDRGVFVALVLESVYPDAFSEQDRHSLAVLAPFFAPLLRQEYHSSRQTREQQTKKLVQHFQKELALNKSFESINNLFSAFVQVTSSQTPIPHFYQILESIFPKICAVVDAGVGFVFRETEDEEVQFYTAARFPESLPASDARYLLVEDDWASLSDAVVKGLYIGYYNKDVPERFFPPLPLPSPGGSAASEMVVVLIGGQFDADRAILVLLRPTFSQKTDSAAWLSFREQTSLLGLIALRLNEVFSNAVNTANYQHFVQDVMHQINNSFSSLAQEVTNLKEGLTRPSQYPEAFAKLFETAQVFRKYIETGVAAAQSRSLLEVYNESPRLVYPADLIDLINHTCEFFLGKAKYYRLNGPQVVLDSFRNLPPVYINPDLFELVLFNLLDNAVKYTRRDADLPILIEAGLQDNWLTISVTNHGIGLTEDEIKFIFNRYERSQAAKDHASYGTGIGLHLCREIMKLHKGYINARPSRPSPLNTLAEEVVFTLYLPVDRKLTQELAAVKQSPSGKPIILFVEDDRYEMEGLRINLETDFEIMEARNFDEARSRLIGFRDQIKLILLDIRLNDPNRMTKKEADVAGVTFAHWVLKEEGFNIPVIVHTAQTMPLIVRELEAIGVKEVVRKWEIVGKDLKKMIWKYLKS